MKRRVVRILGQRFHPQEFASQILEFDCSHMQFYFGRFLQHYMDCSKCAVPKEPEDARASV